MFIARRLKKENIVEYLLYMWQVENLLRAYNLDLERLNADIVLKYPVDKDENRRELYDWYESLIDMMRSENIVENGHLQINKNVIIDLDDFHDQVLKSGKVNDYNVTFFRILPLLNQLRMKSEAGLSDIELCFNFQYGFMLLRMTNAEITPQTEQSQKEIARFMQVLSKAYKMHTNGELDLE